MEQTGVYSEEDVSNWEESNINSVTDEWSSVKVRRKENKQKYSDQCTYQFNCPSGTGCTKKHSEEEKEYFRIRKEDGGIHSAKSRFVDISRRKDARISRKNVNLLMEKPMLGVFNVI